MTAHDLLCFFVADGITTCLADVIAIMARWYSHIYLYRLEKADVTAFVADAMATGYYFSLSSMLLIRTSSHICGRWYLPIFLFRDGLLTLMNIDSFINLERLPSVNKIKVDLPYVNKKNNKFWQKFKIMKYNTLHTPSKVGVLVSIIFSHTPEEAMSGGLAKACVPIKN